MNFEDVRFGNRIPICGSCRFRHSYSLMAVAVMLSTVVALILVGCSVHRAEQEYRADEVRKEVLAKALRYTDPQFPIPGPKPSYTLDSIMVTLELKNASPAQLFSELQAHTGLLFAYCNQDIEESPPITISKQSASVKHFLDLVYAETHLAHRQLNNSVIIFKDRNVLFARAGG